MIGWEERTRYIEPWHVLGIFEGRGVGMKRLVHRDRILVWLHFYHRRSVTSSLMHTFQRSDKFL